VQCPLQPPTYQTYYPVSHSPCFFLTLIRKKLFYRTQCFVRFLWLVGFTDFIIRNRTFCNISYRNGCIIPENLNFCGSIRIIYALSCSAVIIPDRSVFVWGFWFLIFLTTTLLLHLDNNFLPQIILLSVGIFQCGLTSPVEVQQEQHSRTSPPESVIWQFVLLLAFGADLVHFWAVLVCSCLIGFPSNHANGWKETITSLFSSILHYSVNMPLIVKFGRVGRC